MVEQETRCDSNWQPLRKPLGTMTSWIQTTCIATTHTRLIGRRYHEDCLPSREGVEMHRERFYSHAKRLEGVIAAWAFAIASRTRRILRIQD